MAFHNLCQNATLPPGIANLLGLGLKYCLEAPLPRSQLTGLQQSLTRFERTVRIRHLIPARCTISDLDYIWGLYIPSKWQPDRVTNDVEHHLEKFRKGVLSAATRRPNTRRYNLSPLQRHCLGELQMASPCHLPDRQKSGT